MKIIFVLLLCFLLTGCQTYYEYVYYCYPDKIFVFKENKINPDFLEKHKSYICKKYNQECYHIKLLEVFEKIAYKNITNNIEVFNSDEYIKGLEVNK